MFLFVFLHALTRCMEMEILHHNQQVIFMGFRFLTIVVAAEFLYYVQTCFNKNSFRAEWIPEDIHSHFHQSPPLLKHC